MSKNQFRIIIMIGAPASGKGTQARLIAERLGFFHLESSRLAQYYFEHHANDRKVKEAKKAYDAGKLIPTETFFSWIEQRVRELYDAGKGIVFDGSPRTLYEAEHLIPLVEALYGKNSIRAFYLIVSEAVAIKRSLRRRVCDKCGSPIPFSEETKDLSVCPRPGCGGHLVLKSLDTPEIIKKRLAVYHEETTPAIEYLRARGYLREIDGNKSINEITESILKLLGI